MAQNKETVKKEHYTHSEIMVVMSSLLMVMLLAALDQTIVSTALPKIATELHGLNKLSWVATAYLITSAISTPIYGKISDMFGRKKIFQTAIVLFLVGSVLCGIAQTMNQLVAFRALQGLGGGMLQPVGMAIALQAVPEALRGRMMAILGLPTLVGPVLGPVLGGVLVDHGSWRVVFAVNVPLGLLAFGGVSAAEGAGLHTYRRDKLLGEGECFAGRL